MIAAISFSEVISEARLLVARHVGLLLSVGAAIVALNVGLEWMTTQTGQAGGALALSILVSLTILVFIQYLVVEELLADRLAPGQAKAGRRFLSMLGAMVLAGLAIVVGFVLLVLPGIYLAARWQTMTQQIVEKRLPAIEALAASWEVSDRSQGTFIAIYLVAIVPTLLTFLVEFVSEPQGGASNYWVSTVTANLLSTLSIVGSWVLATAAHRVASPVDHLVGGVFD